MRLLKDVRDLNAHVLEVLSEVAQKSPGDAGWADDPDASWRLLSADARWRAAQMPFLLLDLRFHDVAWWDGLKASGDLAGGVTGDSVRPETWQSVLASQTLMLAWAATRADGLSAGLLFGMARPVVEIVGSLAPQRIESVSQILSPFVRLRFCQSGNFWRRLVTAANQDDASALREVHLYGLRLLGGEILRSSSIIDNSSRARHGGESVKQPRRVIPSQVVSTD